MQELDEPEVALKSMSTGHEVVEDYGHVGLSLRRHPISFLRADLTARKIVSCAEAMQARDGKWLEAAGLVLVRQRPGSAKGVLFVTIADESGIANLVVWAKTFETFRRAVMGASLLSAEGRVQREGEVVHLVVRRMTDLSAELRTLSQRSHPFPLAQGRGDQAASGGGPDPRDVSNKGLRARDLYDPTPDLETIKLKSHNFH